MKELEERILQDGIIINNEILKIDSFINHQIDVNLLNDISKYIAQNFSDINKILTIETSGIAFAMSAVTLSYILSLATSSSLNHCAASRPPEDSR